MISCSHCGEDNINPEEHYCDGANKMVGYCAECGHHAEFHFGKRCHYGVCDCLGFTKKKSMDWKGMAKDLATKLAEANHNIDHLVSVINSLANAAHVGHQWQVPNDTHWQTCRHPDCIVAQLAFKRLTQ